MNKLVIVGGSAMGREVFAYARDCGMEVKGFLDTRKSILDGYCNADSHYGAYPAILGEAEAYTVCKDEVFVCAIGDPVLKMKYVEIIRSKNGRFVSVVHPTAYVGMNVHVGTGCIVCPGVSISNDTVIGEHVIVNLNASINHDNKIAEGCTLCPGCHLAGRVEIGKNVFVGTGATIIPDVRLGDGVFVAAGATVTKSFDSGRLMGVPATVKQKR